MNAIEVQNLSLSYEIVKPVSIKQSLFALKKSHREVIPAIKNISFSVEEGEILGVIGKNGSGKSTLLKALAGIFSPNSGEIRLFDNTISLMSIGVGFQNNLSGRDNIFLSGLLMGFSQDEINRYLQEIIEFSELGSFVDMPVKTYSSGMYSKLAFSISAILETNIMLVDEVLSVGDARFKKKSLNKMKQLISDEKRTVLIASHSSDTIKKLCTKVLWMNDGEIVEYGKTVDVLKLYNEYIES